MLIGRTAEWAGIEAALAAARDAQGRTVLLRGEAGVGKTALLDRAAETPGFRVLRATGVEAESDLAYASAHQLLYPLLPFLDDLPATQAGAVRVALGLEAGSTPDRFLVALGFLSLVSEAAHDEPLLLALDDVQWWDTASLDALLFVARRVAAEPVLLLLAAREQAGTGDEAITAVARLPGVLELPVGGLPDDDVGALMAAVVGVAPPEAVSHALAERTHGNPLALVEMVRVLTPDQLAGRDPLPDALSLGERLERPFLQRAAVLPPTARDLLLVAAAEPGGELDVLAEAAGVDGLDRVLEAVETSGLVRYDGRNLLYTHPLARAAVYGDAGARERHEAHLRLAAVQEARGQADRAVWHRAAATLGIDDGLAAALDGVAERSRLRSGHAAAAAAYERAADLSSTGAERVRRLSAAADSAWLAGQSARARLLVERAEPIAGDPLSRGRLVALRARAASRGGEVDEAHRLFLAGADLLRDVSPGDARELLAEAVEAAAYAGDLDRLEEISVSAQGLRAAASPRERFLAAWLEVSNHGMRAHDVEDPTVLLADLALGADLGEPRVTVWCGIAALNLGDPTGMMQHYVRALEQARRAGAAGSLPYVLEHSAMSLALAGNFGASRSGAEEGLRLARESEQQRSAGQLLAILAFVAATVGDEEECLRCADEARAIAGPRSLGLTNATVTWARSRLDLGLGRYDQAVDRLVALASAEPGEGHPVIALWCTPDLVESAARARRTAEVGDAVARIAARAGAVASTPGTALAATWCRGLLGGPGAEEDLATAAEGLAGLGLPLGAARARLALGELLRRERKVRAAREHLRAALEGFQSLGARVWAERAAAELRASGEGASAAEVDGIDSLTAQELQIVRYVSQGASNKDIAAQLFLSPRTVEYHLYKAYPKLGVASRGQLISRFAGALTQRVDA
ncbi:helix-turn-helix transcriptional regulator [Nocardioides guangzhouensis]|uniref:helix-turn-helix transcriptional regulator n=1 Tax=Nocardioides guangzhouensis TaxID=2497878 RepID=UPI001438383A|nr:helix-turn-helix transcriptional regulator [Nocardioides guangzhouensis]